MTFTAKTGEKTSPELLLSLAERCEKATGRDREIDIALLPLVGLRYVDEGHPFGRVCYDSNNHAVPMPCFTASLDAAMTLVPEGMIVAYTNCDTKFSQPDFTKSSAIVGHADDPNDPSVAATPALALCAAALRAIATTSTEDQHP